MNSIVRFAGVLFAAAVLAFLSSCSGNNVQKSLNDIETYIDDRPDSALTALRTIDTLLLVSASSKAKYSLLSAIAYDKNYIDTTDVRVIEPAVEYYSRVNDKERLMKAVYYRGLMYDFLMDRDSATRDFSQSWDLSQNSKDFKFKGIISAALSRIYSYNHNSQQELYYAQKAEEMFQKAGDDFNSWFMQSIIPSCYGNTCQWEQSDSLYNLFFSQEIKDTAIYSKAMLDAVKTMVWKADPDPEAGCKLFEDGVRLGARPTVQNLAIYAYALEKAGKTDAVNSLLPLLDKYKLNPKNAGVANLWEYRIYKHRREYEQALSCFEGSIAAQDSMLIVILGQSLEKVQKDYFAEKSSRLSAENKAQKSIFALVLIALLALLSLLLAFIIKKRQEWIKTIDEAESIKNDLELLLTKKNSVEKSLARLQEEYVLLFKEQYLALENLCSAYWSPSKRHSNEKVLELAIASIKSVSEEGLLEKTIDVHLDGIISSLRKDLPQLGENTFRMICFFIIGFSGKTIATIMNVSVGTVYTTKNRIKKHILDLDSPNKEQYLKLIF